MKSAASARLSSGAARSFACVSRSQSRREAADKLLDAGQDRLLIAREGPVIAAVELDESRPCDVAGEEGALIKAAGPLEFATVAGPARTVENPPAGRSLTTIEPSTGLS
jgi:hypothetical protein